jgi:hypothetical protein
VCHEARSLVGLAQQQRKFAMQVIELGAQRNGAVHQVAVFRTRPGIHGDGPMLVVGQDADGHEG